jgi:hypothetical protein
MALFNDVIFIVKLADGSEHRLRIDADELLRGDGMAHLLAEQSQKDGEIPAGRIVSVRRAPDEETAALQQLRGAYHLRSRP